MSIVSIRYDNLILVGISHACLNVSPTYQNNISKTKYIPNSHKSPNLVGIPGEPSLWHLQGIENKFALVKRHVASRCVAELQKVSNK